ncbi:MAG TPA: tripartite tricarboxylate transporter TctB family protein [Sphaerochaeta sp.]|jgi:membrane protein insertase Oxa1/YidC/SpoIIIJ|nr:tripartite tricarboxylate transporter TctB family protein [Sphaerochaeta sp.]
MDNKQKDFVISLALVALGVYTTVGGVNIYLRAAKPPYNITDLGISPGLLPIILGALLLILSLVLFFKTLKESSLAARTTTLALWFKDAAKNKDIQMMVGGMVIMAIYSFLLVGLLPYWIASTVFLIALMSFLRASKFLTIVLVALIAVGSVILLFQVGFNVSLP